MTTSGSDDASPSARPPPRSGRFKYVVLPGNEPSLVLEALARRAWWSASADGERFDFWWAGNGQRFPFASLGGGRDARRRVVVFNRIERHREICTKTGLARIAELCAERYGRDLPWRLETHVVQPGNRDEGLARLRRAYDDNRKRAPHGSNEGAVWIVKPAAMNRGRGIHIFAKLDAMERFLRGGSSRDALVVQKYIERPLLIDDRKFDIRMFVLVTSEPRVFLHPEGYVRTCSVGYDAGDLSDATRHLTNDAVQKGAGEYGAFEECNKLSASEFDAKFPDVPGGVWARAYAQIKTCLAQVFPVAVKRMRPANRAGCFEVFGLDFMLDRDLRAYLIEINTSPALFRKGRCLSDLLPRVIEETMQRALDPHFPPPPGFRLDADPLDAFEEIKL